MQLKFPLHHYDQAGRVKPPLFLYVGLGFLCRGALLFIIALSTRERAEDMMRIFYPEKYDFYLSLLAFCPAALVFLLLARRESIWKRQKAIWFKALFPLTIVACAIDICLQVYILQKTQFTFSLARAVALVFGGLFAVYLFKSKHMKEIRQDWAHE
ncbi:DUF2919 domain-containing protein [Glaciecola sp. 1036]|uniref:DUF2919 domain-containing protein n=1 Tax=Alteromonadaceae TaxID=72275 RepID=UPI003D015B9B